MLGPVVEQVATLTKRRQITRMAVAGVVVEVGGRQIDHRCPRVAGRGGQGGTNEAPAPVAPGAALLVPPAAVAKVADQLAVRPGAVLTTPAGALEADHGRKLRPVDRIEPTVLGAVVSTQLMKVDSYYYWYHSRQYVGALDLLAGVFKSYFFGSAIALISCHRGFHSKAGAEGVGKAATEAFVYSFIVILVIDFVIGILWNAVYYAIWPNASGLL